MKNKKLQEIRFQVFVGSEKQENRLRHLSNFVSSLYSYQLKEFFIPDTSVLLIGFSDFKDKEYFTLGNKINQGIGGTGCYFDLEYFLSENEAGKKSYILQRLHHIMTKYATHFDLPLNPLNEAYKQVSNCDYYIKDSKTYISKNKQISFWIESKSNYDDYHNRLAYQLKNQSELNYLDICTKEYFFGVEHPEMIFEEIMNTPMFLKEKGWIDDKNFEMAWGEEKYIFNTDELAITFFQG